MILTHLFAPSSSLSLRIGFVVLLMLLGVCAHAETGYVVNHPITIELNGETFNCTYITPSSIYTCSDDCVVVVLTAVIPFEPEGLQTALAVKLDQYGNLLWQRDLYNPSLIGAPMVTGIGIDNTDTVSLLDGNYEGLQRRMIKIDSNGNVTLIPLNLNLPNISWIDITKAMVIDSGEIIAVGGANGSGLGARHTALFKLNQNGSLLGSVFIPPDTTALTISEAYDIAQEESGNLLMSCRLHPNHNDLLRLDTQGNIIDRIPLQGDIAYPQWRIPVYVHHSEATAHSVVAYCDAPLPPLISNTYVVRVSSLDLDYQQFPYPNLSAIHSLLEIGNQVYLVSRNISGSGLKLINLSFNDQYEIMWDWSNPEFRFYYPTESFDPIPHVLARSNSNCIYIAGKGLGNQLAVAKVLPTGLLPADDEVAVQQAGRIIAYPNPMKDVLTIQMKAPAQAADNRIEIYNIKGQLVHSLLFSQTTGQVWDGVDRDGRTCPSGIYLIKDRAGKYQTTRIIKIK